MSNQYSGRHPNDRQRSDAQNGGAQTRKQSSDTLSQVSDAAQSATSTAKKAASEAASTITDQVKELLDSQLASGAEMVGHLGSSAQRAADDLDQNAPQLAGLVRGVADRIEGYAVRYARSICRPAFPVRFEFHAAPAGTRFRASRVGRLFRLPHD